MNPVRAESRNYTLDLISLTEDKAVGWYWRFGLKKAVLVTVRPNDFLWVDVIQPLIDAGALYTNAIHASDRS